MKKLLFVFLVMLSVCLISLPTNAASKKAEKKAVEKVVKQFCKGIKAYNEKQVVSCFQPKENRDTFMMFGQGDHLDKSIRKVNKKWFKYSIKKISVNGEKATATVKVKYFNGRSTFIEGIIYAALLADEDATTDESYQIMRQTCDSVYKKLSTKKKKKCVKTKTLKIPMIKIDGKWKIEKCTSQMETVLNAGMNQAIYDIKAWAESDE